MDELMDRARAIGALAREHALETEQNRQVSAELIGKMREAELFRIMQPARFGGFEFGYDVFVDLVAAVATGDGSTGWVYSLGAVHPWLIACYPEKAQQEVWSQDRDAIAAVSYAPTGKALQDKDGYRLSGRFSFASGCDNANWGILGGMLPLKDGPKPASSLFRDHNSRSMMTGSRWGWPAPAARPSSSTISFQTTAPSASTRC
jgi:alkylation response protein AidB-like acyl-CoA dehydrogenase